MTGISVVYQLFPHARGGLLHTINHPAPISITPLCNTAYAIFSITLQEMY